MGKSHQGTVNRRKQMVKRTTTEFGFGPEVALLVAMADGDSGMKQEKVLAYETAIPGLVVNRDPRKYVVAGFFNLTHANTGYALARNQTAPRLHAIVDALRRTGFDWTSVHSLDDWDTLPKPLRTALVEAVASVTAVKFQRK
jgi:hypothetical protein